MKAALAALLVFSLVAMWRGREQVVGAYRERPEAAAVRLGGVDLDFQASDVGPSPYTVAAAPDTRRDGVVVAFGHGTGDTLPPVELGGGEAVLSGTVTGPDGPVAGATVRLERHTSEGIATFDTLTREDGTWIVRRLLGGRYRVRAWFPGLLTTGGSEVRWVADEEVATFDFSMWGVDPTPHLELVTPDVLHVGVPGEVALFLGAKTIDADGIVVTNPVPGVPIAVRTTAQVAVENAAVTVTGVDGVARYRLRCLPSAIRPTGTGTAATSPLPPTVAPVVPGADPTAPGRGSATDPGRGSGDADSGARDGSGAGDDSGVGEPVAPAPGPEGSLVATTDQVSASFPLPRCEPRPVPEVVPGPDGGPTPAPDAGTADRGAVDG